LTEAVTIDISVGKGGFTFTPNSVTAAQNDVLAFHFYPGDHSVVEADFSSPCVPNSNAFFSGYVQGDNKGDMTYLITVNDTNPIWFYCSQSNHCVSDGMVGVVNPPDGKTAQDFANAAKSVSSASAPASAVGGTSTSLLPGSTVTPSSSNNSNNSNSNSSNSATTSSSTPSVSSGNSPTKSNAAGTNGGFMALAGVAGGIAALIL